MKYLGLLLVLSLAVPAFGGETAVAPPLYSSDGVVTLTPSRTPGLGASALARQYTQTAGSGKSACQAIVSVGRDSGVSTDGVVSDDRRDVASPRPQSTTISWSGNFGTFRFSGDEKDWTIDRSGKMEIVTRPDRATGVLYRTEKFGFIDFPDGGHCFIYKIGDAEFVDRE